MFIFYFMLTACDVSSVRNTGDGIEKKLLHNSWALESISGETLDSENLEKQPQLEINLTDNKLTGNDGCNSFFGEISGIDHKYIEFSRLGGTKMACRNMELSDRILEGLARVQSYRVASDKLVLYNRNGDEILSYKNVS
ncbi:MAG: META domain-containing protein [Saprospiraceae bacterium]|nr:META domain-containing protein [Saprospiraceae bacterium]